MKSKGNVIHVILQFYQIIITQFHTQVKVFHSNNGHEFVNQPLANIFKQHDIFYQTIYVYTPQQNDIGEHKN